MLSSKGTILDLISRCNDLRSFKQIHSQLITSSVIRDNFVVSKVAEFLGTSVEFVDHACEFLNQIDSRTSSFPFNTLIAGYAGSDRPQAAVLVYRRLILDGFLPDMFTFPMVLKSCTKFLGIGEGKQIHGIVVKMGFFCDLYVQNSLLHFYSACGACGGASRVFDDMLVRDVVSWTGLISGYVRSGLFDKAVPLFLKMDVKPNIATLVSVLVACGRLGYLNLGKGLHGLIFKFVCVSNLVVTNALLDMYVKCVEPDKLILTSVLSACSSLGALDYGRWVHEYIDCRGIKWDSHIGTAMVDMYAKCGCIEMALQTFYGMSSRNVFTWNALLGGLAMHGHGHEVLKQFEQMVRVGVRPNEVTFLAILTACCHSGLVDEGRKQFYQIISQDYNLSPRLEHYGCMVDLLCRAGLLDEAQQIISSMPMPPDVLIWGALLSAFKANGNVDLSQDMLDRLHELELRR
ncbi:hypothetical protein F0562_031304 [Nyssa sinensis]|uniref:Uncharacterized protein n=1 Tax=Nyssa sinensis TaxID=561372 RepID=A0A5J5AWB7_9ASTE|nr:hypothetical protein F0562_031304 [Nyssa sinensis]